MSTFNVAIAIDGPLSASGNSNPAGPDTPAVLVVPANKVWKGTISGAAGASGGVAAMAINVDLGAVGAGNRKLVLHPINGAPSITTTGIELGEGTWYLTSSVSGSGTVTWSIQALGALYANSV